MFQTIYLLHTSPSKFNEFSISKFRVNCLDTDTKQFGCYFYFVSNENDIQYLVEPIKRYGKRHGNTVGYFYKATALVDDTRLINTNGKIEYNDYRKLAKHIGLDIDELSFAAYDSNRDLFYRFCKKAYKKFNDWQKVADILIEHGWDGYIDGDIKNPYGFGTIVLFNTTLINITEISQY